MLAFPEGGSQPFVASAFYPALGAVLVIAALIVRDRRGSTEGGHFDAGPRVVEIGTLLYAAALLGAFLIPTAVGGNADRLGALFAGPLAACVLYPRRQLLLLVLAPLLCYWQVKAPIADFASAASDPAVHASYYTPLLDELGVLGVGYGSPPTRPARIEVVPTRNHWEARWLAPHVMLARGWERQLDQDRDALFYDESTAPLTPARYRAWLSEDAISYVALPDAPLDYSGKGEARLLRGEDRGAGDASGDVGPEAQQRSWGRGGSVLPTRNLALGALAPVRGARRPAAGRTTGRAEQPHQRLLHSLDAPPRVHDGADPLHPLLGDPGRARLREPGAGRLDRGAGARSGQCSCRDRLLCGEDLQSRSPLFLTVLRERLLYIV